MKKFFGFAGGYMAPLLMPKATAVWLVENTALTFEQIADFCGLHRLEVQAIADGEVGAGMRGLDPVASGQLTREEIARCEADPRTRLKAAERTVPLPVRRTKGARYTPISKRQDKPDAIAWLLKHYPDLTDAQISRLIGTTKPTIKAVRERSHWNAPNISPRDPVELGLCTVADLEKAARRAQRAKERAAKEAEKQRKRAEAGAAAVAGTSANAPTPSPVPPSTDTDAPETSNQS
jgi:hypothetical protein